MFALRDLFAQRRERRQRRTTAGAPIVPSLTFMKPNRDKIDNAVLALLRLTSFTQGSGAFRATRAWKGHDWEALNRLHAKGYISNPARKAKSVMLSEAGKRRAEELFRRLFCD
jgi:hypothetical protein